MMHKVKDAVSKFFHPSFLLPGNDDPDRSKRKRPDSTEEVGEEQQFDRTPRASDRRTTSTDDEPQLTDDEDNNGRDVSSTEQQAKRRRTANYQHLIGTPQHRDSERTPPPSSSTDSVISSSHTTPILRRTSMEQNYTERINRSRQRLNLPLLHRRVASDYDPSKSPLFSAPNRNTTRTTQSNDIPANHLLATSLINRSSPPVSTHKQTTDTLRNPVSNEQRMLGAHYLSISSRRLPYIERLRRRTLQDSVRLDRTPDSKPLTTTTTEEKQATTTPVVPQRVKAPETECGVQCDLTIVEPPPKSQRAFPPIDVRDEVLSMPSVEKIQTASSITIERPQTSTPKIIKPKVLGDITPFSWPKFARAQTDYANKYPEKCRADAVVRFATEKLNASTTSTVHPPTASATIARSSPARPVESVWKCPCCTKEHAAQTATCSLCHGINPDYKKLSATQTTAAVAKEPHIPIPSIPMTNQTTITKESLLSTAPPPITISSAFPSFGTTPVASSVATTKESPVTTTSSSFTPVFALAPLVSQQSTVTTTVSSTIGYTVPTFGMTSALTTVPETTASTTPAVAPRFMFGTVAMAPPVAVTTAASAPTTAPFAFGISTTKESSPTINRQPPFGTSSAFNPTLISQSNSVPIAQVLQPFASTSPVSRTTTASGPTGFSLVQPAANPPTSIPFGSFGSKSFMTSTAFTPVVSTVSSSQLSPFATPLAPLASSTTANNSSSSASVVFFTNTPSSSLPTSLSFAAPTSTVTTSAPPTFGTGGFGFTSPSTSSTLTNAPFGFNASSASGPFASSPMSTNSTPPFGSNPTFGTTSMTADRPENTFTHLAASNPPSLFSFGSAFNPPPTSVASTGSAAGGFSFGGPPSTTAPAFGAASTGAAAGGGFSFGAPSTTAPAFGASSTGATVGGFSLSAPLTTASTFGAAPSTQPSSLFNFGVNASVPTTANPFPFSTAAAATNPLDASAFPSSSDDGSALFAIESEDTTSSSPRRILRARRREKN